MQSPNCSVLWDTWKGASDGVQWTPAELLLEVDFKWLMAGQGCWIDPVRLHQDPRYAADCLGTALQSTCEPLRSCATCLQEALGLAPIY